MRPLLALVLACSACTGATQASRDAWDKAVQDRGNASKGTGDGSRPGATKGTASRDTWQALAQFTVDAGELLAGGSTTVSLPRLAEKLCTEVPEALAEDPEAESARCVPRTPLAALGHDFELDLGHPSTIGVLARDLTEQESGELVRQILQRLRGVCRGAWARADNALGEFHTCPTAGGAELAVGRYPANLGAGQWHFSLAVLGPG